MNLRHISPARRRFVCIIMVGVVGVLATGCSQSDADNRRVDPRPHGSITFAKDIAPIVQDNCQACHRPGQSAPFAFMTYGDVKTRASQVAKVTADRFMPPWLPEPGHGEFADCRRLSDEQIALISQWVSEGAVEGNPADAPPKRNWPEGWQLGQPDLVVVMTGPYELQADGADVFRNFVIPVPLSATRHVRAVEIRPGNPRIVRHANVKIDRQQTARQRDGDDGQPGFSGMSAVNADFPDGFVLGWTPGRAPAPHGEGLAWRLEAGADLILMLHMIPSGKPETIQSEIGLYFTDQPPTRFPYSLRLGSQTIDIAPGDDGYEITDAYTLPVDVEAIAVYPHAHYLASVMEAHATLPDGTRQWLVRIPQWDFNWQDEYRFAQPLALPRGTKLSMRFVYDNSAANVRNPSRPPVRVRYGPQSNDEMGDLWLQVMPRNRSDLAVLTHDFQVKELHAEIAGMEQMLRNDPSDVSTRCGLAQRYIHVGRVDDALREMQAAVKDDPQSVDAHSNIGVILQSRGRTEEAIASFRRALAIDPQSAQSHLNLGLSLQATGAADEALGSYQRAVELRPTLAAAQSALGNALLARGQAEQAIAHYRQALAINPDDAVTRQNMAALLMARGQVQEAIDHFLVAAALNPDRFETRAGLARALHMIGRLDEAMVHYREAMRLAPDKPGAWLGTARILATHPDPAKRNAAEALKLAEQATNQMRARDVQALDTLAAACAASGEFARAMAVQQTAIDLASSAKASPALINQLEKHLELYRAKKPLIESPAKTSAVQRPDYSPLIIKGSFDSEI